MLRTCYRQKAGVLALQPCRRRRQFLLTQRLYHAQPNIAVPEAAPDAQPARYDADAPSAAVQPILARRAAAGKLVAGVAAASDSDMFKGSTKGLPVAKRWDHHISDESKHRQPCSLKKAGRFLKTPGIISLGGGLPSSEYFPFSSINVQVASPAQFSQPTPPPSPVSSLTANNSLADLHIGKYDVLERGREYDLSIALNYTQSTGSAQMLRWATEHTELVHHPPYADWQTCQTVGSTGALEQAMRLLCDKARGDSVLTDDFSFATALETMEPLGIRVAGARLDGEGLVPESVDEVLRNWDPAARGGARKPHVLYTVPSGQNPTGATQSAQRRRDIYSLCRKHDLYIIEDDPYYFMQFAPYHPPRSRTAADVAAATTPLGPDAFLRSLEPSLLSMDVDGRVMRLDSLSKMLVPGSRLGWVTASAQVLERFIRHAEVANQGPSGFSQVILHKILDESWGHDGFLRWLAHLKVEYTRRRDVILDACEEFLPKEIVSWDPPAAGMFLWLKVNHTLHPQASSLSIQQMEEAIFDTCIASGVLVARGSWFQAEKDKPPPGLFFRTTFAAATEENMAEAVRRFGMALRKNFGITTS